jgi:hypothetical protein
MNFAGYTNGVYIVRAVKGEKALKIVVKNKSKNSEYTLWRLGIP